MRFPGFDGNPEVKSAVSDAFASGRFPHAIVFQGEPGTGKRTFARLLANALVCRNTHEMPCGECPSCIRAKAGSHPDIRVVEGSGKTNSITVDAIRALTADAYRMPEEANCSIYLLPIENRMTEIVQNKLLKIIEEPPENTVFIFTCTSAEQLLPTIRSRVQIYTLRPPAVEEAADFLVARGKASKEEALRLATACGGNIGQMLLWQDGGSLESAQEIAARAAALLLTRDEHELLAVTAPLIKNRQLLDEVLRCLGLIFRDACIIRTGGGTLLSAAREEAEKLGALPVKRLMQLQALPEEYRRMLERNANMTLLVTLFCAQMRGIVGR